MISVLRTSRLRGPGSLPDSALRAEGIPSGSSAVHAVHMEARRLSMPLSSRICDGARPWGHVRGFWGQLQMDS